MISSPTEKGVVMIGGRKQDLDFPYICTTIPVFYVYYSSDLIELSGDSKETLVWKILEQKLRHPRLGHVSFSISNHIAASLTRKTKIK